MKAKEQTTEERLQEIGEAAMSALAEMVAALGCDYDRLKELREERDEWNVRHKEGNEQTDYENGSLDADELKELESAAGDCKDREDAEQRISQDPLSLELRSGWYAPGSDPEPEEFTILLGTGEPAVRIIGRVDQYRQPSGARLQTQDWFTPWTDYRDADQDVLLTYCQQFYFGD